MYAMGMCINVLKISENRSEKCCKLSAGLLKN